MDQNEWTGAERRSGERRKFPSRPVHAWPEHRKAVGARLRVPSAADRRRAQVTAPEPQRSSPAAEPAAPKPPELRCFLGMLYPGLQGAIELRAIHPETGKVKREWCTSVEKAIDAILWFERRGYNVYCGVATRARRGGKKEDLGFVAAAYVDQDSGATLEQVDGTCDVLDIPHPALVVHSGNGIHCYWVLREPLRLDDADIARLEAINRGLCRLLRGDPAATDATRILRPPGTTNRPGPEKRAKGRVDAPVRLLRADDGLRCAIDDLALMERNGRPRVVEGGRNAGSRGTSTGDPQYERREWTEEDPPPRVREIFDRDGRVRALFEREALDDYRGDESALDQALANKLARRGLDGWEIEAAVGLSRTQHGATEDVQRKGERVDYLVRTTNKALEGCPAPSSAREVFAPYLEAAAREDALGDEAPEKDNAAGKPAEQSLPVIRQSVSTPIYRTVNEAEQALLKAGVPIYARSGALVYPTRLERATEEDGVRRPAGALVLHRVSKPWLSELMGGAAEWLTWRALRGKEREQRKAMLEAAGKEAGPWNLGTWVPDHPKVKYAEHMLARPPGQWKFPVLTGIAAAPTIDARTGRIIQAPGYDRQTGLLLDFKKGAFPPVPEHPTRDAALAALETPARVRTTRSAHAREGDPSREAMLPGWKSSPPLPLVASTTKAGRPSCSRSSAMR